jgi:hypothetical protein
LIISLGTSLSIIRLALIPIWSSISGKRGQNTGTKLAWDSEHIKMNELRLRTCFAKNLGRKSGTLSNIGFQIHSLTVSLILWSNAQSNWQVN